MCDILCLRICVIYCAWEYDKTCRYKNYISASRKRAVNFQTCSFWSGDMFSELEGSQAGFGLLEEILNGETSHQFFLVGLWAELAWPQTPRVTYLTLGCFQTPCLKELNWQTGLQRQLKLKWNQHWRKWIADITWPFHLHQGLYVCKFQ